jgi:hypothetical protein
VVSESAAGARMPTRTERIIRTVMHLLACVTLALTSILLVFILLTAARIGSAINRLDPGPDVTGCPFGDLECGG